MMKCALDKAEKIVRKGENADYRHLVFFLQCFLKVFSFRLVQTRDHVKKDKLYEGYNVDGLKVGYLED